MSRCPVCNSDKWNNEADSCTTCGITGQAITIGFSRMRRWSKRFRYVNANKLKKRKKHGRPMPAPSRLVRYRSPLRGSEAAQLARRHADTLRAGVSLPKPADRRSGLQDDDGRE